MKIVRAILILCLAMSASFFEAKAQTVWGSPALDLPIDARSSGLGFKLAADLEFNGEAGAYNPAQVDSVNTNSVYISYLNYYAGTNLGSISSIVKATDKFAIHTGARFISFGEFDGFDASGVATSNFSGGDYFIQSGVNFKLDSTVSAGVTLWGGFRNLAMENAGSMGVDIALMKRWEERHMAVGVLVSGAGRQFAGTGTQPVGFTPINVSAGFTKGFNNAPFVLFLNMQNLQKWDLAPDGTYDDGLDPLTGEVVPNSTWVFGDQLIRHLNIGVELKLGPNFKAQVGYDHRRRTEMIAQGRQGTNGFSIGAGIIMGELNVNFARNTYHFSGSSTHLTISLNLPS